MRRGAEVHGAEEEGDADCEGLPRERSSAGDGGAIIPRCVVRGDERGSKARGLEQPKTQRARPALLQRKVERACSAMNGYPKDDSDDARAALWTAVKIARFLPIAEMVNRLERWLPHVTGVYELQCRAR